MSITFQEVVTLERLQCGSCGGVFAMTQHFLETKRMESGGYHCPYCGEVRGWWKSEADKIREQLEEKSKLLTAAKCDLLREQHEKAELERKLSRTKNGVCPCCNRTFQNLGRHMKTKHKDFVSTK
jgi:ssDNA-binding Zn-finger/Zn-ribbon topoisomerase 1